MRILGKNEVMLEKERLIREIREGAVFIYPTDTIYGIGCNALNEKSVKKIRKLKNRHLHPFSVIAPSIEWIRENCIISEDYASELSKLPGPYTLIFKIKEKCQVSPLVIPMISSLGVRIPNHWISDLVRELGIPVITTSVNKTGEQYMTSLEDIDPHIKNNVDFIFYEGEKTGSPSTILDFSLGKTLVKKR